MSFYNKTFKFAATLLLSSSIFGGAAFAADSTKPAAAPATPAKSEAKPAAAVTDKTVPVEKMDPNTVLITVNDKNITLGDVLALRNDLPEQYRALPPQILIPNLLNQLSIRTVILQKAEQANVTNLPEFKRRMDMARMEITLTLFQQEELKKSLAQQPINDATIEAYYKEHYASKEPKKEAHIRHILVKTEAEAKKIIAEIHAGKKFDVLAKQYSLDKESGNENGDLGWIGEDTPFAPGFLKAAFALKPHSITPVPVKTNFGWHVIQVLDYKNVPVPSLDKVKDEIKQRMLQERKEKILKDIVNQAKIVPNNQALQQILPAPAAATSQK